MLTIKTATNADRADLAARMAAEDRAELAAAGVGMDCLNVPAMALHWNGRLVCLFGTMPMPGETGTGIPWMLCTDTLAEVPRRSMARVSGQVVAEWRGQHQRLANLVHRHNEQAVRFLRWLGFTINETPTGPGGAFYLFTWERANV